MDGGRICSTMNNCTYCAGVGEFRILSSNHMSQIQTCQQCHGVGLPQDHVCDIYCDPEDKSHFKLRKSISENIQKKKIHNEKLREEILDLTKKYEMRMAQLVTLSDQFWEMAKDRVDEMTVVRDKIQEGIILNEADLQIASFALSLVSGEARLRNAKY
jgi:hypothetical protein